MFGSRNTSPEKLSYDELLTQRQAIDEELDKRSDTELAVLKHKLERIAQIRGVQVMDLFVEPKKDRKKRELPPKYINPDNPAETWTGIGKPKKWLQEKLDAGRALDDFAIQ
jgi:DNA-binding protein H-NS